LEEDDETRRESGKDPSPPASPTHSNNPEEAAEAALQARLADLHRRQQQADDFELRLIARENALTERELQDETLETQLTDQIRALEENITRRRQHLEELTEESEVLTGSVTTLDEEVKEKKKQVLATKRDLIAQRQEYEATLMELEDKKADVKAKTLSLEAEKESYQEELKSTLKEYRSWRQQEETERQEHMQQRLKDRLNFLSAIEEREKKKMEELQKQHSSNLLQIFSQKDHSVDVTPPASSTTSRTSTSSFSSSSSNHTTSPKATRPPRKTTGDYSSMLSTISEGSIPARTIIRTTDHSLAPKPFEGTTKEDGARFMRKFERYIALNSDLDPLQLFPLYLKGSPDLWCTGYLKDHPDVDWPTLQEAFLQRFGPSSRGYVATSELMTRQQGPDETVEKYTQDMMERLTLAGCDEPLLWTTYVKGLRPQLRARVLAKHPQDILEAELYAREMDQLLRLEREESHPKANLNMMEPDSKPAWVQPFLKDFKKSMDKMVGSLNPSPNDQSSSFGPRAYQPPPNRRQNRPPPDSRSGNRSSYCTYCQIPGHDYADCRRRRFRCWICNQTGHYPRECHEDVPRQPTAQQPQSGRWNNFRRRNDPPPPPEEQGRRPHSEN
jgi:hypothetical protein